MMMKAGIDLDGVIADLITPFLKEVNKRFYHNEGLLNEPLKYDDVTSYHFADFIRGAKVADIRDIWENTEFILNQPLLPWARWGMRELKKLGYDIYIVTARKTHLKDSTVQWLENNNLPFDELVTGKQEEKWSYIERNNLDIFVDDYTEHALAATEFCKRVYLFDAPYNRHIADNPYIKRPAGKYFIRVGGWRELIKSERRFLK